MNTPQQYSEMIRRAIADRNPTKIGVECPHCQDQHFLGYPYGHPKYGQIVYCMKCAGGRELNRKAMQRLIPGIDLHDYADKTFASWDRDISIVKQDGKLLGRWAAEYASLQSGQPWQLNEVRKRLGMAMDEYGDGWKAGIIFSGLNGTGKTGNMASLGNELIAQQHQVAFVRVSQIIGAIQKTFKRQDQDSEEIIETLANVDFLLLDEMGTPLEASAYTEEQMTEIIRRRSMRKKPYFITTNHQTRQSLKAEYGSQLTAVAFDECWWIPMTGDDLRNG